MPTPDSRQLPTSCPVQTENQSIFENGLANTVWHLRAELCFLLKTCSAVLANGGLKLLLRYGLVLKLLLLNCLHLQPTLVFLFITFRISRLNQKDLRDSNQVAVFQFLYIFYLWFLRQARASCLDRIPCRQDMNDTGKDYQWLSELPLYSRHHQCGLTGCVRMCCLLCLFGEKKKGKEIKKEQFCPLPVLCSFCCGCSFRGSAFPEGFSSQIVH